MTLNVFPKSGWRASNTAISSKNDSSESRDGALPCTFDRHGRLLTCYAHAPGRARAIEVLHLYGFGPYRLQTTNEFVEVLVGRRPRLTKEQYDAIEREEWQRTWGGAVKGKRL
jgi:hypothetical protein